ncbi:DUF3108 domain-containing protein [Massilia yuzhufengensis]|uniref:DUF3108 domain-containing protein n=1 Tax=Massilia yuzhufengensis TaxID=1164594 RepID=A0A1I1JC82_9BURK|nr:DUF3108 domain-containing protein [Massilia yuzhufengensis]SFC46154.1 Protein of unknown function [Massilia yuzhufengensis]
MTTSTTTSPRFGAILARHRRLLALGALSLLLHLMALAWVDLRIDAPPVLAGRQDLAVRLVQPAPPAPAAAAAPAAMLPDTAAPLAPADEVRPAPPPQTASTAATPAQGGEPVQMPSRYRVSMPPSAVLTYEVSDGSGVTGDASLDWSTDGVQYRLAMDGILGRIDSEGGTDDAGIAPLRASYRIGSGSASVAFERERRAIVFESVGRSAQDTPGSQDGASLLMQLAGIGLADPDQLQDAVDVYVGRADGAAVERYQVLGREQLETPLGGMETLHLARTGSVRTEIWLAPGQGWLPVQLRTTAQDGSLRTQTIKQIRRTP